MMKILLNHLMNRKKYVFVTGIFMLVFIFMLFVKFVGFNKQVELVERTDTYLLPESESLTVVDGDVVRYVANNSILIKSKSITLEDALMQQINELVGGSVISYVSEYYYQINFNGPVNLDEKRELLKRVPDLVGSDYNDVLVSLHQPNDYTLQRLPSPPTGWTPAYWLDLVDGPEAWDVTKGSGEVYVGFADTGVNGSHPDLNEKINEVGATGNPSDHGTHVAGIIAAQTNNARGVAAIGYNTNLIHADAGSTTGTLAAAITALADANARVINISVGTPMASEALRSAINYAYNIKRVLVVAAAGNCGNVTTGTGSFVSVTTTICYDPQSYNPDTGMAIPKQNVPIYPAAFANVMAVGSVGTSGIASSFSNRNQPEDGVYYVDVSAPGESIVSTLADGGYGAMSGTSMAAPLVAGLAGLVVAVQPEITVDQLTTVIQESAVRDGLSTHGTVNAQRALQLATGQPLSTPTRGAEPEAGMPGAFSSLDANTRALAQNTTTCADGICSVANWPCKGPDIQRENAKCDVVWREVYAYPPPPAVVSEGCAWHDCFTFCAAVDCNGNLNVRLQWNFNTPNTIPGCYCNDLSDHPIWHAGEQIDTINVIAGWYPLVDRWYQSGHLGHTFNPGDIVIRRKGNQQNDPQWQEACGMQNNWELEVAAGNACTTGP